MKHLLLVQEEILGKCTRVKLIKLAEHYVVVAYKHLKEPLKASLKSKLIEVGLLIDKPEGLLLFRIQFLIYYDASQTSGLTLEQQNEFLSMEFELGKKELVILVFDIEKQIEV